MSRCISEREVHSLLDGSLGSAARRRLEEHLETCARCAGRVESMSRLKAAVLDALPPLEPDWSRIDAAVEQAIAEAATRSPSAGPAWAPLGLSLAAAALVALALFVSNPLEEPRSTPADRPGEAELAHPAISYRLPETLELRIVDASLRQRGLEIGQQLAAGDIVRTEPEVAVRIAFGPQATIDVYPRSQLSLHSNTELSPSIELSDGATLLDIPAGALDSELMVLAGETVFSVLDGTFELSIDEDGLVVAVIDGEITVEGEDGPIALAAGTWRRSGQPGGGDWATLSRTEVELGDGGVGSEDLTEREWERPTGTLPKRVVRETFDRARPDLKACYEAALKRFPELEVSVTARVSVGTRGQVSKVRLRGGERWPDLERCIKNVLGQLSFPPPAGGSVDLIFPLRLSPER